MRLYRIASSIYINDLSGNGGLYSGGRWNEKGTRIIYTAETLSLAILEILANSQKIPENYSYSVLNVPDNLIIKMALLYQ